MAGHRVKCSRLRVVLESVHQTVRLPVWFCLAIVLLLILIYVQVRTLTNSLSLQSSEQQTPIERSGANYGELAASSARREKVEPYRDVDLQAHQRKPSQNRKPEVQPVAVQAEEERKRVRDEQKRMDSPPAHREEVSDVEPYSDGEIAALTQVLEMRLARARGGVIGQRNCSTLAAANNTRGTCIDTTCPRHFHPSAEERIRELLVPRLRISRKQREPIDALGEGVSPKKYIFVTAASSNHYDESQALIYNMRQFIISKLPPKSYSFYFYDLGLKPLERRRMVKNCNCTVKSMDFSSFPSHTRRLMCYAWKPLIIQALLPKADVLVYMDVSIRFRDMDIEEFFATAREWGAQFLKSGDAIPNHTVKSMFDFYGDPPCMYWPFPELLAGFSVLHNEPFVRRLVVEPWVSCALNVTCMCPVDPHAYRICPHTERRVGQCHRFDLSSITVQMAKLYGNKFGHLVLQVKNPPKVARNDRMAFFTD